MDYSLDIIRKFFFLVAISTQPPLSFCLSWCYQTSAQYYINQSNLRILIYQPTSEHYFLNDIESTLLEGNLLRVQPQQGLLLLVTGIII